MARDKRERFLSLGEARVKKAIHTMRLIGNLANSNNYEFSERDAQRIMSALEGELRLLRAKFQASLNKRKKGDFRLQ